MTTKTKEVTFPDDHVTEIMMSPMDEKTSELYFTFHKSTPVSIKIDADVAETFVNHILDETFDMAWITDPEMSEVDRASILDGLDMVMIQNTISIMKDYIAKMEKVVEIRKKA